ncbi:MAG: redox-sensing transcriptional repressor Rex [Candidatus Latescibacterota bacterium]|nr:MAG: redox-sensing transcriptional repressor Rex [Candidatus Latescibacterota bacterium]HDI00068.1 redox-sensing transcriptional repressor Rex [Bacillota bacterium]
MPTKYPSVVPERLSRYLRALEKMKPADFVCSSVLARLTGVSPAQVRKDLAYFGQFGRRGKGYEVESLRRKLREILGIDRTWKVVLVGVGNLGSAILRYVCFKKGYFEICCAFDRDPAKIGREVGGIRIEDVRRIGDFIRENGVKMAIIAVPVEEAQSVADMLVKNGIEAILNFAPTVVSVPRSVMVVNVDITICLERLAFYLIQGT